MIQYLLLYYYLLLYILYENKNHLHHKRKEIKMLNHVEVRVMKVQSFIWDWSDSNQITVLSALQTPASVRFIWAYLLKPKVTERVVFTVEEVEEALADSSSCFVFPQMKEGRLDVSERERGSCVSSTRPD